MATIAIREIASSAIAQDVLQGLSRKQKSLPPTLFYDARGSELFEQICELPEYYLTRTERGILERDVDKITAAAGAVRSVVELGAGTASKTALLLEALARSGRPITYVPIDVSGSALRSAAQQLRRRLPGLEVTPRVADYTRELLLGSAPEPRLILYIGSSIGNFEPMQAAALLMRVRRAMRPEDRMLLGVDLAKSASVLLPAYDDAQGVTAAFNKNILAHINRALGGDFRGDRFTHAARWNREESRIEIYLESRARQQVWLSALSRGFHFEAGETIHTENSYKYTPAMLSGLFNTSGLVAAGCWTDRRHWFDLHLLAPA